MNVAALTRLAGATLSINATTATLAYQALNQTTNRILVPTGNFPTASLYLGSNGTVSNGILGNGTSNILPYAQVGGGAPGSNLSTGDFAATYVSGANTGFVALPATGYYVASTTVLLQAAPANGLVQVTAAATSTSSQIVGALQLDGSVSGGFTTTPTGTVTVASGAIMPRSTMTRFAFLFPAGLSTCRPRRCCSRTIRGSHWTEFNSTISGPGSLVVAGTDRVYLSQAAGVNTFSGGLTLDNAAQVLFHANGNAGSGMLTLIGGAITHNGGTVFLSNAVDLNGAFSFGFLPGGSGTPAPTSSPGRSR